MPEEIYNRNWQWSTSTFSFVEEKNSNYDTNLEIKKILSLIGRVLHTSC